MTVAYIAIGSNLASPLEQVNAAIQALGEIPQSRIVALSSFYRTPPLGPQDQPDYLNAAVALETSLAPEALLDHTQRIELQQGRVRKAERWGPRTLDLDIMLFGNAVINTERLTVPHYDMKNRGFMLWPLFEIAPELVFPDGGSLKTLLNDNKLSPACPLDALVSLQINIPCLTLTSAGKSVAPPYMPDRMRINLTLTIRKRYETDYDFPVAKMQTREKTLRHHYRLRLQLRQTVC
jgi:2-amino-4-hydroxy-6-hydroxymethyldihydropteridine pyrophosphokinase